MKPLPNLKRCHSLIRLCLLAAVALLPFVSPSFAQLPVIRFVRDPDPAPAFQLKDIDGKDLNLDASKGKVVLLNFWATWCGPCREEIPGLIALQDRYKDRLQIIGLVVDDDDEKEIRGVVDAEKINYPVALADGKTRFEYGGIAALPTVFLINAEGRVVQKHVGLYNPALYETEVRALLGLPVTAKIETFQDEGDIFLKHADRAKMLPGVDMTKLSQEQRDAALHKFNAESCDCGCKFTLAQCRIYDPDCQISQRRTAEIVKKISAPASDPPKADAAPGASPAVAPPAADSAKP
jgi:thiol-disulfide isomerase/thioredoxin